VQIKIVLQNTWKKKLILDEPLPVCMLINWTQYKYDLPLLSSHVISRRLTSSNSPILEIQLHGFSYVFQSAYGCVMYLTALHQDTSILVRIATAKIKVASIAGTTIPQMKLCASLLCSLTIHGSFQASSLLCICETNLLFDACRKDGPKFSPIKQFTREVWKYKFET